FLPPSFLSLCLFAPPPFSFAPLPSSSPLLLSTVFFSPLLHLRWLRLKTSHNTLHIEFLFLSFLFLSLFLFLFLFLSLSLALAPFLSLSLFAFIFSLLVPLSPLVPF